ncbi:hypothetical protein [Microbulbifer taiwanensis]|uniref:SPOR domain-containing protein n=1 Tax=Microbulbifer taiwanensis TaxID=986746 RepID=A0ABW1YP26_9GAMM|nr:hypothetical protein [Microbulbifer taiwanensis]
MRWILLALLLANIALFAWFQTGGRPSAPGVESIPAASVEGGERIQLVREVPPDRLQEVVEPQKPQPREREPASAEQLCSLIGPFEEEYQGQDIVERLLALQVDGSLREIEMEGQMRYWVFLAPLGSRREAFNKLRELQAAGVDSYVIPKGSLTNGISFGIFSELDRAELLAAELQARGVAARTREEPQTYLERWIVLPPGAAERLAEDFWVQLQLEYPELDRRQNLCSEVEGE